MQPELLVQMTPLLASRLKSYIFIIAICLSALTDANAGTYPANIIYVASGTGQREFSTYQASADAGCRALVLTDLTYTGHWQFGDSTKIWPNPENTSYFMACEFEYNNSPGNFYIAYSYFAIERLAQCRSGGILTHLGQGVYVCDHAPSCAAGLTRDPVTNACVNKEPQQCPILNPIEIATGNKFQVEDDIAARVPGDLGFRRTYNSISTRTHRLGNHWKHTYERSVDFASDSSGVRAFANRDDGRYLQFTFSSTTGNWIADVDVEDRLYQLTDSLGAPIGWKYVGVDDSVEIYDIEGLLLSITERSGVQKILTYGLGDGTSYPTGAPACSAPPSSGTVPHGALWCVTNSFGARLNFSYNWDGRLIEMSDTSGLVHGYAYNYSALLSSVTFPDLTTRAFHYSESGYVEAWLPGLLTGITDENTDRYSIYRYDANGRATSTEHAGGADLGTIAYTSSTARTVTDGLGTTRTLNFQQVGGVPRISSVSSQFVGCGTAAAKTYDSHANADSVTDFNGVVAEYSYDAARNLETSRTEAVGTARAKTTATQWHSSFRLPAQIDEPGRQTTFTHDSNGNALTKTILDTTTTTSRTWTYTYNSFGQVLTYDGPRTDVSDVTTYTYYNCTTGYQCGQINTITNPLGDITTYNTYNAHGQPLQITDPNGTITTLTYDLRQRLTSRTVGTELTTFDYWPTGLLKKATLPDGSYLQYAYDAAHRLTGINDAQGNSIVYTLDAMGNRTKEESFDSSSSLARTRSQVFNALNQLSEQLGAAATPAVTTSFGYDDNGNQTSIDAPMARSTAQTYDELNRLVSVTDPDSGLTQYGYNALDQLISVTDPRGLATSYTYNGLGDVTQQLSPDTGTTNNTYDSGGNLTTSTDARNAITTYTYDALNRVTTAAFKVGSTTDQTITYNYDAGTNGKGHLTSASDASHSMSWVYDPQGRVTSKAQVQGSVTQSVAYGYTDGLLTSLTTPSGQAVSYTYSNGQVSGITINGTQLLNTVLYDPFGPARQWSWGNGTLSVRTFDLDGKITQLDSAGLSTYAYDDAFRITGITDTSNSNLSWTYDYDNLDRLTDASTPTQILGWTYDANGNRLKQTGTAQTLTYSATSNRLASITGTPARAYTYDAAGNTKTYSSRTFAYNNRGRMKSYASTSTVNYTYNALGQRIKKTGTTRLFVYDEAGHLLGEYSSTGALVQETIWLGDTQ